MVSSRNVIATTICALLVLQCIDGQRRFFPQWGRNNHNSESAQDPNSVDDRFGWSWGVSPHRNNNNRRNPPFGGNGGGGFNNGGGDNFNSFEEGDYYNGPGSFGNGGGNSFNNGPGFNFNGNGGGGGGRFPTGFGNNGFNGNNFNNNVGGFINPGTGQQQQQQQQPPTTTQAPVARTPATTVAAPAATPDGSVSATMVVYSDEFYDCMAQCRTTNEWNPVCGSDMHDYNNVNKLNCANTCGASVQQVRRGPCRPAGK